jgi:hypothetical protein
LPPLPVRWKQCSKAPTLDDSVSWSPGSPTIAATLCITAEGSLDRTMNAPPRPKADAPFSGISTP